MPRRRPLAPLLGLALLVASCSFTRFDRSECERNADCRDAFGLGFVCAEGGFCEAGASEPRCARTWPANLLEEEGGDRIVIGTIVDASLATHVARANAVQLAVEDASNAGGVDGRAFGLVTCTIEENADFDALGRGEAALRVAAHLEEVIGAPIVVGPPSSGETQAVFEATEAMVLLSPSATSPSLTALEPIPATDEVPGRLWRTAPTDEEQERQIVQDLEARSVTDVIVVAQDGAYGDGLVALLSADFPDAEVVRFATEGQLGGALGVVSDSAAEEVIFISSATDDTVSFLTAAAADPTLDDKRFFLTDAAANEDLLVGLPEGDTDLYARIRGTRPATDPDLADDFARRYRIAFGESDVDALSFTTHAYDAGWLALYGASWALLQEGGVSPRGVARGLRQVSGGAELDVGELSWTQVVDAFAAGESVDVSGASGALDYDPATEERAEGGSSFAVGVISRDGARICAADDAACVM